MTRREAAEQINGIIIGSDECEDGYYVSPDDIEALEMAIEALAKVEAIQSVIDMPTLWEQDDRGRYTKVANIIRKDVKK